MYYNIFQRWGLMGPQLLLGYIILLLSQASTCISRTSFLLHNLLFLEMATHSASGRTLNAAGLCCDTFCVDVEKSEATA